MVRPLNDRIAEAMRRERLGLIRPLWADWPEEEKGDWLSRADHLLRILATLGVAVEIKRKETNEWVNF